MLAYSAAPEPDPESDDKSFHQWLTETGILNAFFRADIEGRKAQDGKKNSRFENDILNTRASGNDCWHHFDEQLYAVGIRFKFDIIWVQPTSNPEIKLLFFRIGKRLMSFHRVFTQGNAGRYAIHREAIKSVLEGLWPTEKEAAPSLTLSEEPRQIGSNEWLYTPNQLVELVENESLEYWQYTTDRTKSRYPKHATIGRAYKGQRKLSHGRDVLHALKFIPPDDTGIDLNPGPDTPPPPRFGMPDRDKSEGE